MIGIARYLGSVVIFDLSGNLEVSQQAKLKENLLKLIPHDAKQVVLDFAKVQFIDSACLGALIAVTRVVRERDGDIRLSGMNEEVASIFRITRLDKVFSVFATGEDAVKSFSSSQS